MIENMVFPQEARIWPEIRGLTEFDISEFSRYGTLTWVRQYNDIIGRYVIDNFGKITTTTERINDSSHEFTVDNGKLIGTNLGEFGGRLYFKNGEQEYTIINENVCGILKFKNEIYVLTGLSHLSSSRGKIIKLKNIDNVYSVDTVIEIGAPEVFKIYNDILYIATTRGIVSFNGENTYTIITNLPWNNTSQSSLFINDEIMAIGLWGCIIKIENNEIRAYRISS
jgi:hypothetical protein